MAFWQLRLTGKLKQSGVIGEERIVMRTQLLKMNWHLQIANQTQLAKQLQQPILPLAWTITLLFLILLFTGQHGNISRQVSI